MRDVALDSTSSASNTGEVCDVENLGPADFSPETAKTTNTKYSGGNHTNALTENLVTAA